MQINILDLIIILGSIQGVLFFVYLVVKPLSNKIASNFLALFILSFALSTLNIAIESIGLGEKLNALDFLPLYCSNLIVPSFYFFVTYLLMPNRKFKTKDRLLFLPFIFQFLFQMILLFLSIFNRNIIIENIQAIIPVYDWIDNTMLILGIILLAIVYAKINKYQKSLLEVHSEINNSNLLWLKKIIILLFVIWILVTIPTIYEQIYLKPSIDIFYPALVITSIFIYWIGYTSYSFKYSNQIQEYQKNKKQLSLELPEKTKDYYERLLTIMANEKLYLIPDLNLNYLANKLDLSTSYLSQIINKYESKSFYDFINSYRVEEVKIKMTDPKYDHLNLLGIAMESGFKSKSTFNLAFKKIEGSTPTHYKNSISKT